VLVDCAREDSHLYYPNVFSLFHAYARKNNMWILDHELRPAHPEFLTATVEFSEFGVRQKLYFLIFIF